MQPYQATLQDISDGVQGTRDTLRLMAKLVRDGKKSLTIRNAAAGIVNELSQKDWRGEIMALHAYVRDHIRYLKDVRNIETLQTPDVTYIKRYGDCDDKSVLLAAMLEAIGHPTRFVAVAKQADNYCHVLVETKLGKNWIPAETTEPVPLGWYPSKITSRMVIYN